MDLYFLSGGERMAELIYIIQVIAVITSFMGFLLVYKQRSSKTQKLMMAVMLCLFIYSYGYLLEIMSGSLLEALMAIRMEYLGIAYIATFYLLFLASYLNIQFNRIIEMCLFFHDTLIVLLVFLVKYNNIYYRNVQYVYTGVMPHIKLVPGIIYTYNCIINFVLMGTGLGFIIFKYVKAETDKKKKSLRTMLYASCIPIIAYIIGIHKLLGDYDIVPVGILVSMIIFIGIIMKERMFSITEMAYEQIVLDMNEPIIIADNEFNIVHKNHEAKRISYNFSQEYEEELIQNICTTDSQEYRLNDRYYHKHITCIGSGDSTDAYVIVLLDITKSKEDYVKMEELRNKADAANRAKSIFLANMSHEIRTPLNGIIGYCELLMNDNIDMRVRERAQGIDASAKMLLTIFNEVLDISKIEQGTVELNEEVYNTQSLINDIISNAMFFIKNNGIDMNCNISENIAYKMYGDIGKIRQIVNNTLIGVQQYINKGKIAFNVSQEKVDVDICILCFEIVIEGTYINCDEIIRIYNTLTRKNNVDSELLDETNIGFSISKAYAKVMKARIRLEIPTENEIIIKIAFRQKIKDEREIGRMVYGSEIDRTGKKIRVEKADILVVDDNRVNLDVMSGYFRTFNVEPDLACSGKEAIEYTHKKRYDIIFLDQMMPVMDGLETERAIRREETDSENHTIIIAFTANAISGEREKLLASGFDDFISKPIRMSELSNILVKYLDKSVITYCAGNDNVSEKAKDKTFDILKELGIDVEKALSLCDENVIEYVNTLKINEKYSKEKIMQLTDSYENNNIEDYTIIVHSVKSTLYMIGAKELGDEAKRLEMSGKEGRIEYIDNNTKSFIMRYDELMNGIREFIEKYENDKDNEAYIDIQTDTQDMHSKIDVQEDIETVHSDEDTQDDEKEMKKNISDMLAHDNYDDAINMIEVLKMYAKKE